MLLFGIAALLGIGQPARFEGSCTEGEAKVHIPGVDMMARVRIEDGEPVHQAGLVRLGDEDAPFEILIGYPEPGAQPDWLRILFYSADFPIEPNETLKLTAPDGQHWEVKPRATGLRSSGHGKRMGAEFVFLSPREPDAGLARQLNIPGRFNVERRRAGAVQAGQTFHPLPVALRTLLHKQALDAANEALKPCASDTI